MEIKKSQKADLEGKKSTSMLIGYVIVLAAIFVAFEWTQREKKVVELEPVFSATVEEDMIPISKQPEVVAPPPAAAPKIAEILNIVDNETELVEEEVESSEEMNQAIAPVTGTGGVASTGPTGPVGPVVEAVEDETIHTVVEENPEFPGGDVACMKWLQENIKYPPICVEQNIQGRVIATFVVNKDGSIVDIEIVRSPDPYLSKEAERVLKIMPRWKPGRQRGKPVRVKFSLPVTFRLQ